VDLYNPNLTEILLKLTEKYNVPHELLHLEVTESAYMENPDSMEAIVCSLQKAGFSILMDDFGSGYSSLNTLKNIPVNVLKIDMKFLAGEAGQIRGQCILSSVVRMAGWLGMPVIMEGVETREQVEFLKSIGCGYVQGYYFARPMPVADYEKLMRGVGAAPILHKSENLEVIADIVWHSGTVNELLFDSLENPAAVFEFDGADIRALRTNRAFSASFGYGSGLDHRLYQYYTGRMAREDFDCALDGFREVSRTHGRAVRSFRLTDGGQSCQVRMSLVYWGRNEAAAVCFAQFTAAAPSAAPSGGSSA